MSNSSMILLLLWIDNSLSFVMPMPLSSIVIIKNSLSLCRRIFTLQPSGLWRIELYIILWSTREIKFFSIDIVLFWSLSSNSNAKSEFSQTSWFIICIMICLKKEIILTDSSFRLNWLLVSLAKIFKSFIVFWI